MKQKPESPKCPGHQVNLHPLGGHAASHSRGKLPVGDVEYKEGPAVSNGELRSSVSQVLLIQASPEVLSSVPVRNPRLHRQQDGLGQLGREENAGQETRVHSVLTCMLATERPRRALLSLLLRASVSATPSGIPCCPRLLLPNILLFFPGSSTQLQEAP